MTDTKTPPLPDPGHSNDRKCIERLRIEVGTWLLTVEKFRKHAEKCKDNPVEYARACAHAAAFDMAATQLAKIIRPRITN